MKALADGGRGRERKRQGRKQDGLWRIFMIETPSFFVH